MTFKELAMKRFSLRKYTDEPVSKADIEYIMDCVRLAPSAHNFQPWKFLVVTSEEGKEKVRQCYNRPWFANVPMFVLCFKSMNDAWVRTDDNKNHGDIDLGIAVEHLCLAATDRGLGSCWVCNYDVEAVKRLFPVEGYEAVATSGTLLPTVRIRRRNAKNRMTYSQMFNQHTMKKIILLLMIIAMPLFSNAQEVKHYYIYNIVNFDGKLKNEGFKVTVDNGKTIEKLRYENGKRIVFTTPAGALMYFVSKGWELYSHGSTTEGAVFNGAGESDSSTYWILRKPCTKEEFDKAAKESVRKE